MTGPAKPLAWVGDALETIRGFPPEVRQVIGHELHRVQLGLEPADWKPMSVVGPGVRELRVEVGRAYRVLYLTNCSEAIYVLHAFEKRSRRTARRDIELGRRRWRVVMRERRHRKRPS
jgi:phage-related protein